MELQHRIQSSIGRDEAWKERRHVYQQCRPELEMEIHRQPESRKVPVVYYLCRNRQLEHPHFIEVSLVSPEGLYLRDVIQKFDALRGRGMASMYSWSCKRSYRNAFVWNDLCEDDLILPAHGNEYVLKGSELFEENDSGRSDPARNIKYRALKQFTERLPTISQDDCSSVMSFSGKEPKISMDEEHPSKSSSSGISAESSGAKPANQDDCHSLTKYKIHNVHGLADASTQTEEHLKVKKTRKKGTRSLSIDSGAVGLLTNDFPQNQGPCLDDISDSKRYPSPPSSSSACSSAGKTDTLESLMKKRDFKLKSSERLEEEGEDYHVSTNTKPRASNMLLQLISCGSISAENHNLGRISSYKPRSSDSKFPSHLLSSSVMLGELDLLSENPSFMGMRMLDKESLRGSLVETKLINKECISSLRRSSSYCANRIKECDLTPTRTKCIPRSTKTSLSKQPRSAFCVFEEPRISYEEYPNSHILSSSKSNRSSKRITKVCSAKRTESFEDKENMIKVEERLASGARIIIH